MSDTEVMYCLRRLKVLICLTAAGDKKATTVQEVDYVRCLCYHC